MFSLYRIEVFLGLDGWHWRIRHGNGNKLATSEAYKSKYGAVRVARRMAIATTWPFIDMAKPKARGPAKG